MKIWREREREREREKKRNDRFFGSLWDESGINEMNVAIIVKEPNGEWISIQSLLGEMNTRGEGRIVQREEMIDRFSIVGKVLIDQKEMSDENIRMKQIQ